MSKLKDWKLKLRAAEKEYKASEKITKRLEKAMYKIKHKVAKLEKEVIKSNCEKGKHVLHQRAAMRWRRSDYIDEEVPYIEGYCVHCDYTERLD